LKLYSYFRSSAAYRVRIALNIKGINAEIVPRHLVRNGGEHRASEYLQVNPQGLVPTLVDGELELGQSLAIMEYLDETHPRPALLPNQPADRARVRGMAQLVACDIHPLNNLRVLQYLKRDFGRSEAEVAQWYGHWIAEGFKALEVLIGRYSDDGRYCFGAAVSMADACLVPQVYNARRFDCDLSNYPLLVQVDAHLAGLPEFAMALPERQADAE